MAVSSSGCGPPAAACNASQYRFDGKQKLPAPGAYPTVSPADARQARDGATRLLAGEVDPLQA